MVSTLTLLPMTGVPFSCLGAPLLLLLFECRVPRSHGVECVLASHAVAQVRPPPPAPLPQAVPHEITSLHARWVDLQLPLIQQVGWVPSATSRCLTPRAVPASMALEITLAPPFLPLASLNPIYNFF